MATTSTPIGLRAVYHPSGLVRTTARTISSGYSSSIYQYQPVAISSTGTVVGIGGTGSLVGAFDGVEYLDSGTSRQVYSNRWPGATVATNIVAYVYDDPAIVYMVSGNGAINETNIGNMAGFDSVQTGSNFTGLSAATLNVNQLNTTSGAMQVLNLALYPDNAWGDTYTLVYVRISDHQMVARAANGF